MAWNELDPSGIYFVCFRLGKKRFKRSLKTKDKHEADDLTRDLERTIKDVERGRLALPENADVVTFLLSDGRASERPKVPDRVTLTALFDAYFHSIPSGSLEESTPLVSTHRRLRRWKTIPSRSSAAPRFAALLRFFQVVLQWCS